MITAIDINAIQEYTLKGDRSEKPTVFKLGYFDLFLRAHLSKELAQLRKPGGVREDAIFVIIKVIQFGLRDWDLKDAAGQPAPFTTQMVEVPGVGTYKGLTNDALNRLQMSWVNELADAIMQLNFPFSDPDAEKNSPPPSPS